MPGWGQRIGVAPGGATLAFGQPVGVVMRGVVAVLVVEPLELLVVFAAADRALFLADAVSAGSCPEASCT